MIRFIGFLNPWSEIELIDTSINNLIFESISKNILVNKNICGYLNIGTNGILSNCEDKMEIRSYMLDHYHSRLKSGMTHE